MLSCDNGWYYRDGSCYFFGNSAETFEDSRISCHALGSLLVVINGADEQAYLEGFLGQTDHFYIGLERVGETTSWLWDDSSELWYSNWGLGEPSNDGGDEDCGHLNPGGKWNDISCTTQLNYVCEKSAGT
ncbi:CD209 antigen-like protein A [Saccoglossus kowalevskii]